MERNLYLVLTDTGTLFTRLIKRYTKKPYNHASLAFDKGLRHVYSFGRKKPHQPFIGGFVKEDLRTGLFTNAKGIIYRLPVTGEEYEAVYHYIKKIEAEKHLYHYNILNHRFLFNRA